MTSPNKSTLVDSSVVLNITCKNKTFQCSKFRKVICAQPHSSFSIKVTINLPSAWFIFLLSLVENEVTRAKGSSNLLTLDNTDKYICLLGGIV